MYTRSIIDGLYCAKCRKGAGHDRYSTSSVMPRPLGVWANHNIVYISFAQSISLAEYWQYDRVHHHLKAKQRTNNITKALQTIKWPTPFGARDKKCRQLKKETSWNYLRNYRLDDVYEDKKGELHLNSSDIGRVCELGPQQITQTKRCWNHLNHPWTLSKHSALINSLIYLYSGQSLFFVNTELGAP